MEDLESEAWAEEWAEFCWSSLGRFKLRHLATAGLCGLAVVTFVATTAGSNDGRSGGYVNVFFGAQSSRFIPPLLLPEEQLPWSVFTAAPGKEIVQCFFNWEAGKPFAIWGFHDDGFYGQAVPLLAGKTPEQIYGSFCHDLAPLARVTPETFVEANNGEEVSYRGNMRLDMVTRTRSYTWYFFASGTSCSSLGSEFLPATNYSISCYQNPDRKQHRARISADYLWDVPMLLGMLLLCALAFTRVLDTSVQARGSAEWSADVRQASIAGLAVSFAASAIHMQMLSMTGIKLVALAKLAELAASVGHVTWICFVLSSQEAVPQHFVSSFAVALASPAFAGSLLDSGCAAAIGVRDGLQSGGDFTLLAEWLHWCTAASTGIAWIGSPFFLLAIANGMCAVMVAAMALLFPTALHVLASFTLLISIIIIGGIVRSLFARRLLLRSVDLDKPCQQGRGIGQGFAIGLWLGSLPFSSLPFLAPRIRHTLRLMLLLLSHILRLASMAGFDPSSVARRQGCRGLGSFVVLHCKDLCLRFAQLSWQWLLILCFMGAMVYDTADYTDAALQARINRLPDSTEMDAKLAKAQQDSSTYLGEVKDQLAQTFNDIAEVRRGVAEAKSAQAAAVSRLEYDTALARADNSKNKEMLEKAWSLAQMLRVMEKDEVVRELLAQSTVVPKWWHQKEDEVFHEGCRFRRHAGSSLGAYTEEGIVDLMPSLALAACIRAGVLCKGITCRETDGLPRCTPRRGSPWLFSDGETSYKKECALAPREALLENLPSANITRSLPFPRNFSQGTKLVVMANIRQDVTERQLSVLLEEQHRREMDKLELFVSVDDPSMEPLLGPSAQKQADTYGRSVGVWSCTLAGCWSPNPVANRTAAHYMFVLDKVFSGLNSSFLILLGEDYIPSSDFLLFFQASQEVLVADDTLWCASAWNDYSTARFARDPKRLFRTASFPGIGWMMSNKSWQTLRSSWPTAELSSTWQQWLAGQPLVSSKECLQPEVSRVFSNIQTSEYFSTEESDVFGDVHYLQKDHYEQHITSLVGRAARRNFSAIVKGNYGAPSQAHAAVYLVPILRDEWPQFAEEVGLRTIPLQGFHRGLVIMLDYTKNSVLLFNDRKIFAW